MVFHQIPFVYTVRPPVGDVDSVDGQDRHIRQIRVWAVLDWAMVQCLGQWV